MKIKRDPRKGAKYSVTTPIKAAEKTCLLGNAGESFDPFKNPSAGKISAGRGALIKRLRRETIINEIRESAAISTANFNETR